MTPPRNTRTQVATFGVLTALFLVLMVIAFVAGRPVVGVILALFVLGNLAFVYKLSRS
jgi:hypothetical protein